MVIIYPGTTYSQEATRKRAANGAKMAIFKVFLVALSLSYKILLTRSSGLPPTQCQNLYEVITIKINGSPTQCFGTFRVVQPNVPKRFGTFLVTSL